MCTAAQVLAEKVILRESQEVRKQRVRSTMKHLCVAVSSLPPLWQTVAAHGIIDLAQECEVRVGLHILGYFLLGGPSATESF